MGCHKLVASAQHAQSTSTIWVSRLRQVGQRFHNPRLGEAVPGAGPGILLRLPATQLFDVVAALRTLPLNNYWANLTLELAAATTHLGQEVPRVGPQALQVMLVPGS